MRKCNARLFGAVWLVLVALCGCGEVKEYVRMAEGQDLSPEYQTALNAWTREKTVYSQFETRLHVTATLKSDEFRKAYAREYGRRHDLDPDVVREREEAAGNVAQDFLEVAMYAYTPEREDNDFERARSIWTVFLVDAKGKKTTPLEIRRVDPITAATLAFYPYIGRYHGVFYSLKFPPRSPEASARLKLILTSVRGRAELDWAASEKR